MKRPNLDRVMEIVSNDENIGICLNCGNEQPAEPDARNYNCDVCEQPRVYGAEEILLNQLF